MNKSFKKFAIFGVFAGFVGSAQASDPVGDAIFNAQNTVFGVQEPELRCLDCGASEIFAQPQVKTVTDAEPAGGGMGLMDMAPNASLTIDGLMKIGTEVWKIVEANRPVVNLDVDQVSVLPTEKPLWTELAGWKAPEHRTYEVVYKNLMGFPVVTFKFRVLYTAGGRYKNKGQYLTHVTVVPDTVAVAWGFDFNATAKVPSIVNMGTHDNRLAGAEMYVEWRVKSVTTEIRQSASFFVAGDGRFQDMN